ncbi:MAG: DUF2029 domain-containing protein [Thermoleophilaceae bacterium]|nr:DUF2029 domain-containing protein [Thermoleophilaceae bacterium]
MRSRLSSARFAAPATVIFTIAVLTLGVGYLAKSPCLRTFTDSAGELQLDWRGARQYRSFCYSDIVPLYGAERLDRDGLGGFPYAVSWVDGAGTPAQQLRYMEYPVLTGLFQWGNAQIAKQFSSPGPLAGVRFFQSSAFWLSLAWLLTIWALIRLSPGRPWDPLLAALSPLVAVHAFTNFDTLAIAAAVLGLLAWSRRRPGLAGMLLGVGGALKLFPLFLLLPLVLLCVRAGRFRDGVRLTLLAVGTWAVVNAPIAILFPDGWAEFLRLNSRRGIDPDSIYNVFDQLTGWNGFDGALAPGEVPSVLNLFSAALFLLACVGIAWIAFAAPRRPRVAQLAFLTVCTFLLVNKVWSPQFSLWLIPLAVLAIPRWKPLLAWMAVDALVWFPRMLFYLGPEQGGWSIQPFLGVVVARDLAVLALCLLVVRDIWAPGRDPLRGDGSDDPHGGVLDQAPDRLVLGDLGRTARA